MKLIDRHVLATFIPPFFFGFSVMTFLLMIQVLQDYFNLFLEKGIHVATASEVLLLSLGHTIALTVPMAVLIGVLMAMGHLAADQEITALKACGVSLYRLTRPLLFVAGLLTASMIAYNHYVLPNSNHRLRNLLFDIHQLRPTLEIRPNTFAEINEEYTIFVRHKNDRTGILEDVILFQREGRGDPAPDVVVAESGTLETLGPGRIQLDLFNGEYHRLPDPADPLTYNRTNFNRQTFMVDLDPDGQYLRRGERRGEREMDLTMLQFAIAEQESLKIQNVSGARRLLGQALRPILEERQRIGVEDSLRALNADMAPPAQLVRPATRSSRTALDEYRSLLGLVERNARSLGLNAQVGRGFEIKAARYDAEWHKKFSIPLACMVFVVLGVPLAIVSARGGRGVSVGVSLFAFIVYYVFLSTGEKLADRGLVAPWIAMWSPNIVLGTAGIILLQQSVRETKTLQLRWPRPIERWWQRRLKVVE